MGFQLSRHSAISPVLFHFQIQGRAQMRPSIITVEGRPHGPVTKSPDHLNTITYSSVLFQIRIIVQNFQKNIISEFCPSIFLVVPNLHIFIQ